MFELRYTRTRGNLVSRCCFQVNDLSEAVQRYETLDAEASVSNLQLVECHVLTETRVA